MPESVTKNDVEVVRARERAHDWHDQLDRARGCELAPFDVFGERLTAQIFEHHERLGVPLADVVDDDDVLVTAPRGGARLEDESRVEVRLVALQELDRDAAAELGVARQVHGAHAAATELADQLVGADSRARRRQRVGAERRVVVTAARRAHFGELGRSRLSYPHTVAIH